jgi:hypothetical protein
MTKLIRVDKKIYAKLHALAGRLQAKKQCPVSLSEAIAHLFSMKKTRKPRGKIKKQAKQPLARSLQPRREIG